MTMTNTQHLSPGFGKRWVATLFATFGDHTGALAELDRRAGDGDFGANVTAALRRAHENIDAAQPQNYQGWLTAVSRGFLGTGGTSGPLFGMFFRDLARCAEDGEPTVDELSRGLSAGVATIQRYGGAELGHKTMVDALDPAARALESAAASGTDAADALGATAQAAVEGARSTAELVAKRGRASYVGEVARGVLDPGAAAAAMVLQSAAAAARGGDGPIDTAWLA